MTRQAGEARACSNERHFPFVVQIAVPKGGFGPMLDAINAWHRYSRVQQRNGQRQRIDEQDFCRWCFEDVKAADIFRQRFGGEMLLMMKPRGSDTMTAA
jgi:hypothetical protein